MAKEQKQAPKVEEKPKIAQVLVKPVINGFIVVTYDLNNKVDETIATTLPKALGIVKVNLTVDTPTPLK